MAIVNTLLARIGLVALQAHQPDAFDMRLTRIGTRERRLNHAAAVFKS